MVIKIRRTIVNRTKTHDERAVVEEVEAWHQSTLTRDATRLFSNNSDIITKEAIVICATHFFSGSIIEAHITSTWHCWWTNCDLARSRLLPTTKICQPAFPHWYASMDDAAGISNRSRLHLPTSHTSSSTVPLELARKRASSQHSAPSTAPVSKRSKSMPASSKPPLLASSSSTSSHRCTI